MRDKEVNLRILDWIARKSQTNLLFKNTNFLNSLHVKMAVIDQNEPLLILSDSYSSYPSPIIYFF